MTTPDIVLHNAEPRWINVRMLRHHSTVSSPQAGYAGSGPADTALSILAALLPHEGPRTTDQLRESLGLPLDPEAEEAALDAMDYVTREAYEKRLWDGYQALPVKLCDGNAVHPDVWRLHHDFEHQVLAPLGEGLWRISSADVLAWIQANGAPEINVSAQLVTAPVKTARVLTGTQGHLQLGRALRPAPYTVHADHQQVIINFPHPEGGSRASLHIEISPDGVNPCVSVWDGEGPQEDASQVFTLTLGGPA